MENFHYRIKFGDIEVEASGSEEFVKEIRAFSEELLSSSLLKLRTLGAVTPTSTTKIESEDSSPKEVRPLGNDESLKDESLPEFLERLPSRTHQEKILAFGYYLEKVKSMASFGVKEINDCYDMVKEAKSNSAQYMVLLIKSGLIMKKGAGAGGASQYVLTRKGENIIRSQVGL
jgi:hypothetical protein